MRIVPPPGIFVAAEEFLVGQELGSLLDCASFAEEHVVALFVERMKAPESMGRMPDPPRLPNAVTVGSVVHYHACLRKWLGEARKAIKRSSEGARAVALADAARSYAPVDMVHPSEAQIWSYLLGVDESAKLLALYCDAIALTNPGARPVGFSLLPR